jgi:hypothetical protein
MADEALFCAVRLFRFCGTVVSGSRADQLENLFGSVSLSILAMD